MRGVDVDEGGGGGFGWDDFVEERGAAVRWMVQELVLGSNWERLLVYHTGVGSGLQDLRFFGALLGA